MTRRFPIEGRHVLITGAAGGIGSALARRLLRAHGCRLLLADRDAAGLRALQETLAAEPGGPHEIDVFEVDLASRDSIADLARRLEGRRLDVLVNNAGIGPAGSFARMSIERIEAVLAVNLHAAVSLTRRLLPTLLENDQAFIVNVASAAGLAAPGGLCAYAASKFGMVGFSEALRVELRDRNVGVAVICPSFVRTDIVGNSLAAVGGPADSAEAERCVRLDAMAKRLGVSPEKVVDAIIRAVRRDRGRVVVGSGAGTLLALRSLFPGLADRVNLRTFRRLVREGLIE